MLDKEKKENKIGRRMIKKWLKILSVVCFLAAQIVVAAHIHCDENVSEQECVYCQAASELSGSNVPEALVAFEPIYLPIAKVVFLSENTLSFNLFYQYNTRAPPFA